MGLTLIDGVILVDDDTGEILEGEEHIPGERIEWLARQHRAADDAEREAKASKALFAQLLRQAMDEAGIARAEPPGLRVTRVADSAPEKALAQQVQAAQNAELLTASQAAELLIFAARELDKDAVIQWIGQQPEDDRAALRAVLLIRTPRRGYVTTKRIAPPPAMARVEPVEVAS